MKKIRTTLAALICLTLVVGLLPAPAAAQDAVSGDDLRAGTVERVQAIMDVDWTLQNRIAKANIAGEERENFIAGGIVATTYFEYSRLQFNYKGVMVQDDPATMEEFAAMADPAKSVAKGIPHNTYAMAEQKGMDINSFLTDISTRLMAQPLTGLKEALTSAELTALAEGADLAAATSKAAISADAAKAGYAKLGAGDLLLAWENGATGLEDGSPRIHALVVKEVNGQQVTVMYPAFSLLLWYFQCDKCGVIETEGPTSAALPNHVHSLGYSFGSFMNHENCGGTWAPLYATTWRTETVTFDALYGDSGSVPYASKGYLPYTFNAYATGAKAAQVKVTTDINEENYLNGFDAKVVSDYRITGVKAAVVRNGQEVYQTTAAPKLGSKEYDFSDAALNEALRRCPTGSRNSLELYVRSGPLTATELEAGAWHKVYTMDFYVGQDVVRLKTDATSVDQGQQFQVTVETIQHGITGLKAQVSYADCYAFELAATRAANPGITFADDGKGTLTLERYGDALGSGAPVAKLVFRVKRTGDFAVAAQDSGEIYCGSANVSTKAGATAADLKVAKPDASSVRVGAGYDTMIFKNYAGGKDLLILFTSTREQILNQTDSSLPMTYDGQPMYDVTHARYLPGEGSVQRTYAVIVDNADSTKIGRGETACPELIHTNDVNGSGALDISDLQTVSNIINGKLPLAGNEAKWFFADVDRSGKVDAKDMDALWAAMTR